RSAWMSAYIVRRLRSMIHLIDDHQRRRPRQFLRADANEGPIVLQTGTRGVAQEDRAAALLGQLFDALAQVDRLADGRELAAHARLGLLAVPGCAETTDERLAGVNADADDERRLALGGKLGVQFLQALEELARRRQGEVGVIGLGMRRAEEGHDAVAE